MVAARSAITQYDLSDGKASELNPPERRPATCPECERLWKIYSVATRKYLDASLAQEDPAEATDTDRIKFLENQALEASQWRELARKAIRDHSAMHAGLSPETPE
jgi:hypothetical protein